MLLDIGLPGLNGYEARRRARAQPWGGDITFIALTGWGQEEDRRRTPGAGFDGHLVKPVEFAALMAQLTTGNDAEGLRNGQAVTRSMPPCSGPEPQNTSQRNMNSPAFVGVSRNLGRLSGNDRRP